jgi:peptide/nickel transport system permease protein
MADTTLVHRTRWPQVRLAALTWRALRRWPVLPVVILAALVVVGVFAPLLAPHNPIKANLADRNTPPIWAEGGSSEYILGTDQVERDILSRLIHGARVSLLVTAISLTSGLVLGVAVGLIAGYFGGHTDELLMRLVEIQLGIPFILIALVAVIVLGQTFILLLALLALFAWPPFARNIRGEVLSLKTRDYVALARVAGASTFRILLVHILPGVINTVIVIATLRVGQLILTEAILSFLGAGIPPPRPAWGAMIADGRDYLSDAWWIASFPGIAIFLVVMSLNFLGDWFRDRFDPRLRQLE